VLNNIKETGRSRKIQRHFQKLMSDELPEELRRRICQELWGHRLKSLDLIDIVVSWDKDLLVELAQIVHEETYASHALVCKEGEIAMTAYLILWGRLHVESSNVNGPIPNFSDGMWLGEKALTNPWLHRGGTIVTLTMSTLMSVPAHDFHELLQQFSLHEKFHQLCQSGVQKGLCGRCGNLGNHFSDSCPLLEERSAHPGFTSRWLMRGSIRESVRESFRERHSFAAQDVRKSNSYGNPIGEENAIDTECAEDVQKTSSECDLNGDGNGIQIESKQNEIVNAQPL